MVRNTYVDICKHSNHVTVGTFDARIEFWKDKVYGNANPCQDQIAQGSRLDHQGHNMFSSKRNAGRKGEANVHWIYAMEQRQQSSRHRSEKQFPVHRLRRSPRIRKEENQDTKEGCKNASRG